MPGGSGGVLGVQQQVDERGMADVGVLEVRCRERNVPHYPRRCGDVAVGRGRRRTAIGRRWLVSQLMSLAKAIV